MALSEETGPFFGMQSWAVCPPDIWVDADGGGGQWGCQDHSLSEQPASMLTGHMSDGKKLGLETE